MIDTVLQQWRAARGRRRHRRRLHLHFYAKPRRDRRRRATARVAAFRFERTEPDGDGRRPRHRRDPRATRSRPSTAPSATSAPRCPASRSTSSTASSRTTRARCCDEADNARCPASTRPAGSSAGPVGLIGHTKSDAMETDQARDQRPGQLVVARRTRRRSRSSTLLDDAGRASTPTSTAGTTSTSTSIALGEPSRPRPHQGRAARRDGAVSNAAGPRRQRPSVAERTVRVGAHANMRRRAEWQPDVLGEHFEQLTLPLARGRRGRGRRDPRALRARLPPLRPPTAARSADADVLYVHGWSDYFFQTDLARYWHEQGARFYALDLRKYGRSLRPGQTPGFVDDLRDLRRGHRGRAGGDGPRCGARSTRTHRRLILMGHSTGGLTLSLWARSAPRPGSRAHAEQPVAGVPGALGSAARALAPLVDLRARLDPKAPCRNVDLGFYTRTVSRTLDGEWDYNLAWRPVRGLHRPPGVAEGHARRSRPRRRRPRRSTRPCSRCSRARSTLLPYWTTDMLRSDVVLVVRDIAERALGLAPTVTVVLGRRTRSTTSSCRAPPVRACGIRRRVERWMRGYLSGS